MSFSSPEEEMCHRQQGAQRREEEKHARKVELITALIPLVVARLQELGHSLDHPTNPPQTFPRWTELISWKGEGRVSWHVYSKVRILGDGQLVIERHRGYTEFSLAFRPMPEGTMRMIGWGLLGLATLPDKNGRDVACPPPGVSLELLEDALEITLERTKQTKSFWRRHLGFRS